MRISTTQIPDQGVLKVKVGAGTFISSLNEGDGVKAEVLSGDKGSVVMKTDNGQTFRARLDSGVTLSQGDKVLLEVTGKEARIVSLAIKEDADAFDAAGQSELVRGFEDKTLLPYANKLAQLNLPVTEESASSMKQILSQNPGITQDEAAFLAANKLTGDDGILIAAKSMLSGGDKTDVMLERLLKSLLQQGVDSGIRNAGFGISETLDLESDVQGAGVGMYSGYGVPGALNSSSPLMEWLALIDGGALETAGAILRGELGPETIISEIITQSEATLLTNSTNNVEISVNDFLQDDAGSVEIQNSDITQGDIGGTIDATASGANSVFSEASITSGTDIALQTGVLAGAETLQPPVAAGEASEALGTLNGESSIADATAVASAGLTADAQAPGAADMLNGESDISGGASADANSGVFAASAGAGDAGSMPAKSIAAAASANSTVSEMPTDPAAIANVQSDAGVQPLETPAGTAGKVIAELLSGLREFQNTPVQALERFSDMLLRAASDSTSLSSGDVDKLAGLFEQLFTRVDKADRDVGQRLRSAKEELFARLVLLEETISRSSPPAKAEILEHTRRLIDHVRLLNNIEQFAYLQLPVQIHDQRKTAELYVFKKKGAKRVDPENVNILLALDLENMGHWEGLINFRNKDVSIRMEVSGATEKEYFSENTVLLHEMLAEVGFKLVNTEISFSEAATTPLTALSVFDKITTNRAGSIDFMI